ncbi:hypothetical protein BGW39_001782 [Mortierella sp. 14UC]|nr:hypothetical protein BGW39_001782 [Mortierella sp. 14UC]
MVSHVQCTESFYKASVMDELKSSPAATSQDRKKMLGILDRFERQAVNEEQLLTMSDADLLQHAQQQQQQQTQQEQGAGSGRTGGAGAGTGTSTSSAVGSQRKLTPKEREELIRKAMEEEAKEDTLPDDENMDPEERAEMERMIEQEYQDFVNRFAGVNLDSESFESIWERLNPDERREFQEKFMISGRMDEDDDSQDDDESGDGADKVRGVSDNENEDEEREAKRLLQEMGETLERGGQKVGSSEGGAGGQAMTADLDMDDLKAIRDAEIAELIQIWRPWWEIEAEESGQLKKVVVSKVADSEAEKQDSNRMKVASHIILEKGGSATAGAVIPNKARSPSDTVLEQFVLDEEAMLRPHQALVRPVEEIELEAQQRAQSTVPPMAKAPHPSLIYHICGLLFAFAATIRVFNGDLQEEPEQVLAHIFDLCPFFAPPPPSSTKTPAPGTGSSTIAPTLETMQQSQVEDFETTLAILQTSSLNSKLWKGDTARLEMLSLLLRDLTLILARPSRCLRCVRELEAVFQTCLASSTSNPTTTTTTTTTTTKQQQQQKRRGGLFSKSTLHRLLKKLEFYESYLLSDEWILKSDRLDRVRTEVVVAGIRVRQEIVGWNQEIEQVSRVVGVREGEAVAAAQGAVSGSGSSGGAKEKKVLIEELF